MDDDWVFLFIMTMIIIPSCMGIISAIPDHDEQVPVAEVVKTEPTYRNEVIDGRNCTITIFEDRETTECDDESQDAEQQLGVQKVDKGLGFKPVDPSEFRVEKKDKDLFWD